MRRNCVVLLHLLTVGAAAAGERAELSTKSRVVEAIVNAAGQVAPAPSAPADVERLTDSGASKAVRCADAAPLSKDAARALVEKIATQEAFYPQFVVAVARAESDFRSDAVSSKGAVGLMQLEPETAKRFGVDLCDPADNVRGGVRFLRELHTKYRNPLFILAAYNAGEQKLVEHGGVPPFAETMTFVADVINDFYGWDAGVKSGAARARSARGAGKSPASIAGAPESTDRRWKSGFVWNVE